LRSSSSGRSKLTDTCRPRAVVTKRAPPCEKYQGLLLTPLPSPMCGCYRRVKIRPPCVARPRALLGRSVHYSCPSIRSARIRASLSTSYGWRLDRSGSADSFFVCLRTTRCSNITRRRSVESRSGMARSSETNEKNDGGLFSPVCAHFATISSEAGDRKRL
jgi:hypothetical protein